MENEAVTREEMQEAEYQFPYHYTDLANEHDKYIKYAPMYSRNKLIDEKLGDVSGLSILDVGCGDGRFCYDWRNSGAKLVGIDISQRAIDFAKVFVPEACFYVDDITKVTHLRQNFDRAVLIEVLEHIPPMEISSFLKALADTLKPGGVLLVTVPSKNQPVSKKHYQHFDPPLLREVLSESFEVIDITGYGKVRDLRFKVRKNFARAGFKYRKKRNWLSGLTLGYGDWYHRNYAGGPVSICRGLIAVAKVRHEHNL